MYSPVAQNGGPNPGADANPRVFDLFAMSCATPGSAVQDNLAVSATLPCLCLPHSPTLIYQLLL